jgi:predicted dehydrogenase
MGSSANSRRAFLKAAGGAALAAPLVNGETKGASDKVNIAFIGVGRMGTENIKYCARVTGFRIVAVCDVYQPALDRAAGLARGAGFPDVKAIHDFREILADKSVDAVCISTPDHWHAYMAVEACKAGKDVWIEKPACIYVEEGITMIAAARRYGRVVQGGTMQRSGGFFRRAREIVRSGELGDIALCRAFQTGTASPEGWGTPPDGDPPRGLDWDLWLGPAPARPFNANRFGVGPDRWSTFRYFWDYSGGAMTDWGVHLLDIVQFAFDETMPAEISAQGGKFYSTDNTETPDTMQVTYRYPGFVGAYENRTANAPPPDWRYGTAFHGSKATLLVNRNGYAVYRQGAAPMVENDPALEEMNVPHWRNFLECIRTRQRPMSDIETLVRSTVTCVLANLSMRYGLALTWDGRAMTVGQPEAVPYLKASYRAPWKLEV